MGEHAYSKVVRATWGDAKFSRLSPLKPSGQGLWLYLLTGPHCTVIPGLFPKMGIGTLADRLKWPIAAVSRAWAEILAAGMAVADWDAGVIWLPKAIDYNDPANPNVVTSWRAVDLPQCPIVVSALRSLRDHLSAKPHPKTWVDAFDEVFRKGFPEVFREPSGESGTGSLTGSGSFPPKSPAGAGDLRGMPWKVLRSDRREAKLVRDHSFGGSCPHDPPCETYSICVEFLAVAIASRRYEIRTRSN